MAIDYNGQVKITVPNPLRSVRDIFGTIYNRIHKPFNCTKTRRIYAGIYFRCYNTSCCCRRLCSI